MSVVFQDFFTGSSLNAAWTRRGIVTGDETWNSPGLTVTGLAGTNDFYLMNCPAGDFYVELEYASKSTGSDMIGVAILNGTGDGMMSSAYSSPAAVLNLGVLGYGYSGSFTSAGGGNYAAARIRLTKIGGNYTTAYSLNGGSSWSAESTAMSPSFTATKIGIGAIISSGGTIKLIELKVSDFNTTITVPAAAATAAGVNPTISTGSTVTAPAATATASAVGPTVGSSDDATVAAPAATATASTPAATPSGSATITPPAATATASAPSPTVSAATGATVTAPAATATATGKPATATGGASVTVPAATATAAAPSPSVSVGEDALAIPPADLTITAPAPASTHNLSIPPADLSIVAVRPLVDQEILLTTRWTFYDPLLDETWTMPINPDSEANPLRQKGLIFGRNARSGGRYTTIRQTPRPVEWDFGGVIRSQVHHDTLDEWADRRRIIHVTDHVDRTFEVILSSFEVTERNPTKTNKWRLRYQMKALLLRELS